MNIILTEKAIKEIKHIIEDQNLDQEKTSLRLRVIGGGCSGFTTKLDLDDSFDESKDEVTMIEDVRVVIDKRSVLYLDGSTVDFHDSVDKRGFMVDNPQAISKCGCGSSFSM